MNNKSENLAVAWLILSDAHMHIMIFINKQQEK